MTPADYLEPPPSPLHLINQLEDQPQIFISANHASSSLSCPSFYTIIRDHRGARLELSPNDHEDGTQNLHLSGSSNHQIYSTCPLPDMDENTSSVCGYKLEGDQTNFTGPAKWMPSKMRLMHKMRTANRESAHRTLKISPRLKNQHRGCSKINTTSYTGNNTIRVCSDCSTTTTPLWRSGPKGPKSLCNACGIRQRKQRKAMAEAANGLVMAETSSAKISRIMHSKEKKSRLNYSSQFKNKSKLAAAAGACMSHQQQLSFKDFKLSWSSSSDFPQDEVAEAAILLMELSCGFVHI